MAFMAVLESDLRALSAEARRRYPAVKDGAEHAILKLRSLSNPNEIAHNEDILRIFLVACDAKSVKLSVIGLSCLQKLISHDAVSSSALKEILVSLAWTVGNRQGWKLAKSRLPFSCRDANSYYKQFLSDENELGEHPLPTVRIEETICVLQDLAQLVIHPDTASVLHIQPYLKAALFMNENACGRAHLLVLFPSFCEIVISRETRVRELVRALAGTARAWHYNLT